MSEQQTQKRDGHSTVYVLCPILSGLGLAAVLAASVFGIAAIASKAN
jgi:hypothetical protein